MTATPIKKCGVCLRRLKEEIEFRNKLCWICIRLRNSAAGEKHFTEQPAE